MFPEHNVRFRWQRYGFLCYQPNISLKKYRLTRKVVPEFFILLLGVFLDEAVMVGMEELTEFLYLLL